MTKFLTGEGINFGEIDEQADSIFKIKNYELAKSKILEMPEIVEYKNI